jgi:replication-associated recombination protein RarA
MPENTHQEQQAKKYMTGIWLEIQASNRNEEEIQKLIVFLDEIDRRRRTNWRNLFPWIELV